MRIAIFSDVHGNYAALDAVLADIARRGADLTVGLGDFLSGPFDPRGVADRLIDAGFPTVRGNHDRWLSDGREENDWIVDAWVRETISPAHMDWLRALPATQVIEREIFMCHGTPVDDTCAWLDQFSDEHGIVPSPRAFVETAAAGYDYPVLLCGHTHIPRAARLADGRLVVNPGTVGLPFIIGAPDARYAIIERRNGHWHVELLAVPYDREPAKQQAIALGQPTFAQAIESGWMKLSDL